jgi:hypothetical protein
MLSKNKIRKHFTVKANSFESELTPDQRIDELNNKIDVLEKFLSETSILGNDNNIDKLRQNIEDQLVLAKQERYLLLEDKELNS